MCFAVYIWRSWFNVVTIKNKDDDFLNAKLCLEISYNYARRAGPNHPGGGILVDYYVQVRGGWRKLYTENATLTEWKYGCVTANFVTGEVTLSTGKVSVNVKMDMLENSKDNLTAEWDRCSGGHR
jgi:hypothetical protein